MSRPAGRVAIEYPMIGETYKHDEYGVYRYGTWPRGSVLEGRERRSLLGSFATLAEAREAYPDAGVAGGSGYVPHADAPVPGGDPYDPAEWTEHDE